MSHLKDDEPVKFTDEAGVELDKEEVEDEVLEAVEEAKKPVLDASKLPGVDYDGPVTAISPERLAAVEKRPVIEVTKENRVLVAKLRQNDDSHNRTCAYCLKRKPIEEFARLKKSDVCQDCEA